MTMWSKVRSEFLSRVKGRILHVEDKIESGSPKYGSATRNGNRKYFASRTKFNLNSYTWKLILCNFIFVFFLSKGHRILTVIFLFKFLELNAREKIKCHLPTIIIIYNMISGQTGHSTSGSFIISAENYVRTGYPATAIWPTKIRP